jgi:hypothetical protein
MGKSLLYRLFKIGSLKSQHKNMLLDDTEHYFEEGIAIHLIYKNYKAPGKYYSHKLLSTLGSIGFSEKQILASQGNYLLFHLEFENEKFKYLKFERKNNELFVSYDPQKFDPNQSGEVTLTFKLDQLDKFERFLN